VVVHHPEAFLRVVLDRVRAWMLLQLVEDLVRTEHNILLVSRQHVLRVHPFDVLGRLLFQVRLRCLGFPCVFVSLRLTHLLNY